MKVGGVSREEWPRIRAAGRTRYLLLWGVLGRGIPMALVVMLVFLLLEGKPLHAGLLRDGGEWLRFFAAAGLFSVGGVVSSYARWRAMEQRFDEQP